MITQLQSIRDSLAKNAKVAQGDPVANWVLDTLQQIDALLANLAASGTPPAMDKTSYTAGYNAGFMAGEETERNKRDLLGE